MNKRGYYTPGHSTLGVFDFSKVPELRPPTVHKPWKIRPKSPIVYVWKSSIPSTWIKVYGESHFKHITQTKLPINTIQFLKETQSYIHNICTTNLRNQLHFASSNHYNSSPSKHAITVNKPISLKSKAYNTSYIPRSNRKLVIRSQSQASSYLYPRCETPKHTDSNLFNKKRLSLPNNFLSCPDEPYRSSSAFVNSPITSSQVLQLDSIDSFASPRTTRDLLSWKYNNKGVRKIC